MTQNYFEFAQTLTLRGLGFFGRERMQAICTESGVTLNPDNTIGFVIELTDAVSKLIINFSKANVIAKMTATTLAKQYKIPIPDEINKKKKSSRFKRIFRFVA